MRARNPDEGKAPFGPNPPLPQLTLRVGVSGHRPKPTKLPPESLAFVRQRLSEVFAATDAALAGVLGSQAKCFSGGPAVRLVSGLAEGADQFAIEAMPKAWTLDAVLPFPRDEYGKDFGSPDGDGNAAIAKYREYLQRPNTIVTELPGERLSTLRAGKARDESHPITEESDPGYARLGGFLLRQIDILVAVWDGGPGDKGGTSEVVHAAVGAAIPIVWIHSLNDAAARMVTGIDSNGMILASDVDCCLGPLRDAIEAIVGFPPGLRVSAPSAGGWKSPLRNAIKVVIGILRKYGKWTPVGHGDGKPERLLNYRAEAWPSPFFSVYDAFKRCVERRKPRLVFTAEAEPHRAGWAPILRDDPAAGSLRDRLEKVLLPRYEWADALAVAYSHRYRSAYFACYLLAALAVTIAASGIFLHHEADGYLTAKAVLVTIELLVIGRVMHVVSRGRSERWKEKWMEYRSLAELLFNMRFLSYLAEHGRTQRTSKLGVSSDGWLLWYLGATIREIGLPYAVLDENYQRAVLGALDAYVVVPQQGWHRKNAVTLQRMHNLLHQLGEVCFGLTVDFLVFFLVAFFLIKLSVWIELPVQVPADVEPWLKDHAHYLTFLAASLPAFGAAAASIRTTGDFEKGAERSRKTAAALGALAPAIDHASKNPMLDETGDVLLRAALVLAEDLDSWHLVYGDKRLELPS